MTRETAGVSTADTFVEIASKRVDVKGLRGQGMQSGFKQERYAQALRRFARVLPLVLLPALSATTSLAQTSATAQSSTASSTAAATQSLLEKAHTLEQRGRVDMASQAWRQVLLADPNNTEALGGLARAAKMSGDEGLANQYLQRLKGINPNDPGIERAESVQAQPAQNEKLVQAGKLAQAGQYAQAMSIYRQVFGTNPPPGDWSLAYYETESATTDGKAHAISGLRGLVSRYPQDSRYQIALGRILTYSPGTRSEGRHLLARHPDSPEAMTALRAALVYDIQNPDSISDLTDYLKHHKDPELQQSLRALEAARARGERAGPTQSPEERQHGLEIQAAYNALNGHHFEEAEARFKTILAKTQNDARALAGMGYLRMNQSNFGGAISFLEQAKQDGSTDRGVDTALATSRFWYTMSEGNIALQENDLPAAERFYRQALAMRSGSPEALEGLAGTLMKAQQPGPAVGIYQEYIRLRPSSMIAWRGLFTAQYQAGQAAAALATEKRMPSGVHAQLMRDPEFLRNLASAYSSVGRDADAQRVLHSALELPFPAGAQGLQVETQLQYAALLQAANHLDQAAGLYRQALATDPSNVNAWQGLIRVQHAAHNDTAAEQALESMPPSVYDQALRDPGFITTTAAVYQSQNKLDVAQSLLEKSIAQQTSAGQKPPVGTELQLAGIYMQRSDSEHAYNLYRAVLQEQPDSNDAWKGILTALHSSNHDREALAEIQQIPHGTRQRLETDVDYLQTVAGIYNGLGQSAEAMIFLSRVQQHYIAVHAQPPADIDIQNAWLLFNGGNEVGLYRQLMMLGSRTDLTDEQRRTVQTIWANFSVRHANGLLAQGYLKRPIAILNASARAFPDNPGVYKALASGYMRAGLPKQAVLIFKSQDMTTATASDYKSAVGAALAANDLKAAEVWLRFGLEQYPRDAQMLTLAAKFEQGRGDSNRAAEYYKASLAAMPPPDPGAELAEELSRPVAAMRPPTVAQQQDLASLLAPGTDPTTSQGSIAALDTTPEKPYLPSYGNQYGPAPVVIGADGKVAGAPLVPGYMSNPGYQQNQQMLLQQQQMQQLQLQQNLQTQQQQRQEPSVMQRQGRPSSTSLGDYIPQATNSPPLDLLLAPSQSPSAADGDSPYLAEQRTQIAASIARAQRTAIPSGMMAPSSMEADIPPPGTVIAAAPGQTYGPYVPYQGNPGDVPLYSAVARQVEIDPAVSQAAGNLSNAQTTDVLPSTHYVPNAKTHRRSSSVHPDIAAAEAAETRRNQSNPSNTLSAIPTDPFSGPMSGQSRPSEEIDVAPVHRTQYTGAQYGPPQGQAPRPSALPPMDPTGNTNDFGSSLSYTSRAQDAQLTLGQQYPQPRGRTTTAGAPRRYVRRQVAPAVEPGPAYAPLYYPAVPTYITAQPYPQLNPALPLGSAPTDAQLVQRNLPPLRGYYNPNPQEPKLPLTEREQAELDLATLEASYSPWIGGTASLRFRSGIAGVDHLFDLEAPFEASIVAGKSVRFSVVPKAVFLDSGQFNPAPFVNLTTNIPFLGTLPFNTINTPPRQTAVGIGGEFQMSTQNFGVAVGYTPYEFLVRNITGRFRWKIGGGPVTLFGERDSVKDTMLSYAGMRDPGSITLSQPQGNIWGGVVSTVGGVRFDLGDERAGFYASLDGGVVKGFNVEDNTKFEGTAGAYFRVAQFPGIGSLNVGGTFFGMHYAHNLLALSYGSGGYFSPDAYFLAAVPITLNAYHGDRWHYVVSGAVGIQTFSEAQNDLFPIGLPPPGNTYTQACAGTGSTVPQSFGQCGVQQASSNTGLNFDIGAQGDYRFNDHWFLGGFARANNTNNYTTGTVGFSIHYAFKKQYGTQDYPTGLFPSEGFRPLRVP